MKDVNAWEYKVELAPVEDLTREKTTNFMNNTSSQN